MDKLILFDIDYTLFDTATFKESNLTNYSLYEEVKPTLKELVGKATLGIFSQGEVNFQLDKLRKTGIDNYFSSEFVDIVDDKPGSIEREISRYKNYEIILIDDRIRNLEKAKGYKKDIKTIWVKRGPFAANDKSNFVPDKTVSSLKDLLNYINEK